MTIDYFPYTSEARDISLPAPMVNELLETYKKYHQGENKKQKRITNMDSREQEKQWERQSGLGYHLATLLKNLGADDTAKAQLHEHLVLRIVHDLIDARNQLELVWGMMNAKQIIHITNSPEFMTDVLCYYLRATHPYLENHQPPTPMTWDDLKTTYLERTATDENETPSLF